MSKIFLPLDTHQGVCDALNSGRDDALQPFVDISGLDASAYKKFLTNSCGTLGNVSFISAIIAMVLGFIAFIYLVVFIVCVENIQPMVNFIKWLSVLAGLASIVAVIAWVYQIDPLVVQGFHRGISFVIEIIACQLFMLSAVLVHYHSKDKLNDFK
ncbi:hypothetical protein LEN26_013363 [Aphanomyces euteiches]|nr:hypothetical protein LEN26_013363 [Aphanomyces euteiches]KAH9112285.1 hypothetical protein AeMF1_013362 [Aphanomyces euteiches]KAH9195530.1 hypothetical protein AeNC1_002490 [Aphanomyces euteiches]